MIVSKLNESFFAKPDPGDSKFKFFPSCDSTHYFRNSLFNHVLPTQFSSRPSLVRSVTVVLVSLVTGGKGGEGRLARPGAGLIQPLCRRDGHGRPGCQGGKPLPGAQAPSHAGICQTGTVGKESPSSTKPADRPAVGDRRGARFERRCYFMKRDCEHRGTN